MTYKIAIVFTMLLGTRMAATAAGLDFPMERQMIQRNAEEWAEVKVAGAVPTDTTVVEVKADLGAGFRGKVADWTIVAQGAQIRDGKFSGRLKLATPAQAKTITYLQDKKWDARALLYGKNGIAALTFCDLEVR